MFPLALKVPGIRHIVDWCAQRLVQSFPWWPQWVHDSKVIMQCTHSLQQRELLQTWLRETSLPNREDLAVALQRAPPRCAEWRWTTLAEVLAAITRMRGALRACAHGGQHLFESRAGEAQRICGVLKSESFIDQAKTLNTALAPFTVCLLG